MGASFILRSGPNEEVHPCDASHVGSQVKNTLPDLAVFVGKESDSYPQSDLVLSVLSFERRVGSGAPTAHALLSTGSNPRPVHL